ncbi:hypothetical protein H0H87_012675 [Tephrocybe sp. NHM501043]|nr:hypothetical protein H0H87_012675 [Tephrocybe sp. NHM501043]
MLSQARSLLVSLLPLIAAVAAHKEPKTPQEIEVQRALQAAAYHCAPAVEQYTAARKHNWAQKVLAGRPSLPGYDDLFGKETYADNGVAAGGDQTVMGCTPIQDTRIQNNTCVLTPVVTEGPYYHKVGHPVRQNIAELQDGLLLLLDIGVIDVETCQPLPNVLVDIWQANATGHYAGHPEPAPHLVNEQPQVGGKRAGLLSAFPRTVQEETFLRGAWPTDQNGVAQFTTIFPGYYTGRATHIHTKVFPSWTVLPNGTFTSDHLAHTGQFFFDDEINLRVDNRSFKMHPYTMNPIRDTRGRTRNWRDSLNIFEDSHGPEGKYNPVFRLDLLGGVISQGLVGYITMMAEVALARLANGIRFIGQPVHATLFPYPIAATFHAARISIAYQANARAATAGMGAKLPWGTYIAGYLVMTWGGTIWTHYLLGLSPPMLYTTTPYIIYLTTHLILTLITHLFPFILSPSVFALLDTVLFPLDALVRTGAVTSTTAHLTTTAIPQALRSSVVTYLIIGALASAGGGLTASTLSTWSPTWSFSTPPVLRAPTLTALIWGSMDVWGGALVAAVHATLRGQVAFHGLQQVVQPYVGTAVVAGTEWMNEVEAKAAAAGVLGMLFGLRAYRTHWMGKAQGAHVAKGAKAKKH